MPASKRVGVSDIAKHAGVSIGTVSNYLNYPERVSDTLKEKIGASIKELGYTPAETRFSPARERRTAPHRLYHDRYRTFPVHLHP